MRVLLTGGTGFIGSHTAVALINEGHSVVILDNLSNSNATVVQLIGEITGLIPTFIEGDLNNRSCLESVFSQNDFDAVIHLAGSKSVSESESKPLKYYSNNVSASLNLLSVMEKFKVKKLIFSSSASLYGEPKNLPITEDQIPKPSSVYGRTKLCVENIMKDIAASDSTWRFVFLRYFNPFGAHQSGLIGENPSNIPNNLVPYILDVIMKKRDQLSVYGNDYATIDGTGIRDYIDINDLAEGHVASLQFMKRQSQGVEIFNLGTGKGCSVLSLIRVFETLDGGKIKYKIVERRQGDVAQCFADVKKAERLLKWRARRTLEEACETALRFARNQ